MRRAVVILLWLLAAPAWAVTTIYVDGGCTNDGNGTCNGGTPPDCNCAASGGGAGPYRHIHTILPQSSDGLPSCDVVLNIRGVHATHGSNHDSGTFNGRYYGNEWSLRRDGCTSGTPVIIQPEGWTGAATGEAVYLDGTRCPSGGSYATCGEGNGWTRCTWDGTCDCGTYTDVTIDNGESTDCTGTWFTSDNGTAGAGFQPGSADLAIWAQKDDGGVTYMASDSTTVATGLAALTNNHAGYNANRCTNSADSAQTYIPCSSSADCPSGETCTATSPEIDHYRDVNATPDVLFVRWGPTLPTRPYIAYTQAGDAFALKDVSDWVTIQGLVMRAHKGPVIWVNEGSTNHTIQYNRIIYSIQPQSSQSSPGNGYGITAYGGKSLSIIGNEISFTSDEGIHAEGVNTGSPPTVYTIRDNWIRRGRDRNTVGVVVGTSSGIILGGVQGGCGGAGSEDMTGTVLENNLFEHRCDDSSGGSDCNGVRLENCVSNVVVRNNAVNGTKDACIELDGSDGATDNNEIYNNLLLGCGTTGTHHGVNVWCGTPGTVRDNKVYNNTVVEPTGRGLNLEVSTGTCTGNLFRNNIFFDSGNNKMVEWGGTLDTNLLQYNLISTTANPAATWPVGGVSTSKACAALSDLGTGNIDGCPAGSTIFANASSDYHLKLGSAAIDAGTATGMPAGRATDINNTLAGSHGLPSYADAHGLKGAAWDIGADEFNPGCASAVGGKVTIGGKVTACSP